MISKLMAISLSIAVTAAASATEPEEELLEPIVVTAQRVANEQPASTYPALASQLRFDPQVNLQTRGLAEGQADVTVRGGLFENTGFKLGAVTVFDPQTGHYAVEIPLDPAMLAAPTIATDFDHALGSFNASVASINYGFSGISSGGGVSAGFGSDKLWYASGRLSQTWQAGDKVAGMTVAAAASQGDGTLPFGDHDFSRFSGHLQWKGIRDETNLMIGYHDKFYGWPGAYTGFASLPETDHTKLGLALLDHRRRNDRGWWEIGMAYRWLDDDYDFDRRTIETGTPGSFEHETRAFAVGLAGKQSYGDIDWYLNAQASFDRLASSTDLTNGDFNSRSYITASLAPGQSWVLSSGNVLTVRAGLRADWSNRDGSDWMPLAIIELEQPVTGGINRYAAEYTRTSQLPGYTALNSPEQGLFGGNPDLGREFADTVTLRFETDRQRWSLKTAAFYRRDDDLVDWTYQQGAPFVRQANAVDIDVLGLEIYAFANWEKLGLVAGYAWLDKDADYGAADVDASYYALNFARHRFTFAVIFKPTERIQLRLDNEYRDYQDNPLRSSDDEAYLASVSLSWKPEFLAGGRFSLIADNLTDSDFQEFPGSPAMGRQLSLGIAHDW